jgi:hypothetical protein
VENQVERGEKKDKRKFLIFNELRRASKGPVVYFDETEDKAWAKIRSAIDKVRALFTEEQLIIVRDMCALSTDAMAQRWGKEIVSVVCTPLASNLERLLFGIVHAAVEDCFASVNTKGLDAGSVKSLNALRTEWTTIEAEKGIVFGHKLGELHIRSSQRSAVLRLLLAQLWQSASKPSCIWSFGGITIFRLQRGLQGLRA